VIGEEGANVTIEDKITMTTDLIDKVVKLKELLPYHDWWQKQE